MYLNFLVNIPIETRKITYRKKGETDYVYYEYTRLYKKGSNITNPKRVTIGKRDTQNPAMMVPKELPENNLRILFRVNLIKSVDTATDLRRLFGGIS